MPLRVVRHPRSASLYIRGTVRGTAVYESAGTDSPALAEQYRARREAEIYEQTLYGRRPSITFAAAVETYLTAEPRRPDTIKRLARLLPHFGRMRLREIDQLAVDHGYRVLLTPRAGSATKLRAVLTPLRAVLQHAAARGQCSRPALTAPRQRKPQTTALRPDQATRLVQAMPENLRPLIIFLLATGCRMSEALELDWREVDLLGSRAVVRQKQGTHRQVDLPPVALAALRALPHRQGLVFRKSPTKRQRGQGIAPDGYRSTGRAGGGQIKVAWAAAAAKAGLAGEWRSYYYTGRKHPQRRYHPQATPHITRHTWASWHYCVYKDLLRLRLDGGWETTAMCERYAKLMPDVYRSQIEQWWAGQIAALLTPSATMADEHTLRGIGDMERRVAGAT